MKESGFIAAGRAFEQVRNSSCACDPRRVLPILVGVKFFGTALSVAIIANGLMVAEALSAAEVLAGQGVSVRVVDIATVKPLNEEVALCRTKECD